MTKLPGQLPGAQESSADGLGEDTARTKSPAADLVVEPESSGGESGKFELQVEHTLRETEREVLKIQPALSSEEASGWVRATDLVREFKPVPWFIWRISNFVFGSGGMKQTMSEGFVLGLRRLLFAAASDPLLGSGEKVNNMKRALELLEPGVIAAVSVIHAVSRKATSKGHERIWRPILDDALLRARIGYLIGARCEEFGCGRGMLAGYAGRCGLAILISSGDKDQARLTLELLAQGEEIGSVGYEVYECHPLQVSAMMLSISGCGRDSSLGTVAYVSKDPEAAIKTDQQRLWMTAFTVIEYVRTGRLDAVPDQYWNLLGFTNAGSRKDLGTEVQKIIRRGHGWSWLA